MMPPQRRRTNKHLPERVYQKHNAFYYVDKNNKWHKLGKTLPEAMIKWVEFMEHPEIIMTMDQLFDRYLKEIAPKKAKKTFYENTRYINNLRNVFGHLNATQITPIDVYRYLDIRGKNALVAANREKSLLSHIFSTAIRWGVVTVNPCRDVSTHRERPRDRYIEDWEFTAVNQLASPLLACLINFAYLTALRRGDILSIKLSDMTDEGIKIKTNNTGKKLLIIWTNDLRKVVNNTKHNSSIYKRNNEG